MVRGITYGSLIYEIINFYLMLSGIKPSSHYYACTHSIHRGISYIIFHTLVLFIFFPEVERIKINIIRAWTCIKISRDENIEADDGANE